MKNKNVLLKNPRTGQVWLCEDFTNRRVVDGNEFVEVRMSSSNRTVWMSLDALVKVSQPKVTQKH